MLTDFNYRILEEVAHRPWPMPSASWIMTQTWHDVLFAHWDVYPEVLEAKVPAPLTLDLFNGRAWLGIVPFRMTNVAPRGVPPLPMVSAFAELNVRTYVTLGDKPGVFFFSLDAASAVAVGAARTLFHLPYFSAAMRVEQRDGTIDYGSRRTTLFPGASGADTPAEFLGSYRPTGPVFAAEKGSLEHFLTERYCLYTLNSAGRPLRVEIHHPPWPLQPAAAAIRINTMTDGVGLVLPSDKPLLHFVKRQDVVAWAPSRVETRGSG